nr:DNA polymerase alpha catalytic subunit [Tanacetum cinerariifolium]
CDDETCDYTTLSLNLQDIGDSERGTACPNYPRCNGRHVATVSLAYAALLLALRFATSEEACFSPAFYLDNATSYFLFHSKDSCLAASKVFDKLEYLSSNELEFLSGSTIRVMYSLLACFCH